MSKEPMVYQSNFLINNRQSMTRDENRFFLTMVSQIGKDDNKLTYRVPVAMFAETWNVDRSAMYRKVKESLESLRRKGIRIETVNENGKRVAFGCGFISDYLYIEGEAVAEVSISAKFKPYLLELKKAYTGYGLNQVVSLDSAGAGYTTIRIFEVCSEWAYKQNFNYSISELKRIIDLKDKYPKLYDFKRYVLEPAKDLINGCTNLKIDYRVTGRGEKAIVNFTVERVAKQPEALNDDVPGLDPVLEIDPLPNLDPYAEELPEVDPVPDPIPTEREESVELLAMELVKLPGFQYSGEDVELLLAYAMQNGCTDCLSVSDYAIMNVAYARAQWARVKSKRAYLRSVFKNNYGGWEP